MNAIVSLLHHQDTGNMNFLVSAKIYTTDGKKSVSLNVEPFLRQASDYEIRSLHGSDWGLDSSSRGAALYFSRTNPDVADLFAHVRSCKESGIECEFECDMNIDQAINWLRSAKPSLFNELEFVDQEHLFQEEEPVEF